MSRIARIVDLGHRSATIVLLVFILPALVLTGSAGATQSTVSTRISAHLSKMSFTASEAGSVKLIYRFSKPSKSFSYRLSFQNGSKWQLVTSSKSKKKKGYFKGSRSVTVKKLFAGKPVTVGSYRLKLRADASQVTLSFRVTSVVVYGIYLDITVWSSGRTGRSVSYTLACPVGTGTLPAAADACEQLSRLEASVFAPDPSGTACTQIYGGPQVARVTGHFNDNSIDANFDRHNGCEIARWNRLAFLFPLDVELSITVWPSGLNGPSASYTLGCPGDTGTLPNAASACAQLSQLDASAFKPISGLACAQVWGGPQVARATGRFYGESIEASFGRSDACEINRWERLEFLFPNA